MKGLMYVNKDFPRILTLLREERGLSQKKAAEALGISQPLLSHYEKGIRECGLEFVVRAADLYDVSCDYLLGRSAERRPSRQMPETIIRTEHEESFAPSRHTRTGIINAMNKKLVMQSLHIIFDILDRIDNIGLSTEISSYLSSAVYIVFRLIYSSNPRNSQNMFSQAEHIYKGKLHAVQTVCESNAENIAFGLPIEEYKSVDRADRPELSPERLETDYPEQAGSLFSLIQNTEQRITKTHF